MLRAGLAGNRSSLRMRLRCAKSNSIFFRWRRDGVGLGPCDRTGLVTSGFMNGARDLACRNVRAAPGLERAGLAVMLAREVDHRAALRQPSRGLAKAR